MIEQALGETFKSAYEVMMTGEKLTRPLLTLIADDNPHVRSVLRFGVSRLNGMRTIEGHEIEVMVDEAADGAEAAEKIATCRYELLILDYYMPIMDGGVLVERLRKNPQTMRTPIVLASASHDEITEVAARHELIARISKPMLAKDLCRVITGLCGFGPIAPPPREISYAE
jgi:CheY-like chemotaxis protein